MIQLRPDMIDIGPVLYGAADTVRPLIEERKHKLDVSIGPGSLRVEADPVRLEQIVVNLLTNAAKYTESGGRIRLTAEHDGSEVVIRVRDNGIGIPPDQLPAMFELFVQGDRSSARSEGGLGIGLTLVKSLVEMHGGSVSAASEGPGNGSEFIVRLPAVTSPRVAPTRVQAASRSRNATSRILVVDDNVDSARGLARLLKLLGHKVETAGDGPEALAVVETYRPDVVLLDIGLPGMDGYDVARALRKHPACKDAVIIAVSGYGQAEDQRRSREAGFNFHLVKPIDHDALMTLLSTD
jgi:CheY-like chemotaxis protein